MNNNAPICIFDSGLGGLSVLQKLTELLPREKFIYLGDTANVPYGNKSSESIKKHSVRITKFLIKKNVKLIIVGCNTASAVALQEIKKISEIPIINVIDPCVEKATRLKTNKKIAIIGTTATINSKAYQKKIINKNPKTLIYNKACPLFVPMIEEGLYKHKIIDILIKMYFKELLKINLDVLILGCTHYPLIKNKIQQHLNNKTKIIDSSITTAEHAQTFLTINNLEADKSKKNTEFYLTDKQQHFDKITKLFLNQKISNTKIIKLS